MGKITGKSISAKRTAALLFAAFLLFTVFGCFLIHLNAEKTIAQLMEQDYDTVGAMSDGGNIGGLSLLTGKTDAGNIAKGKAILDGYGYNADAPAVVYPYYRLLARNNMIIFAGVSGVFFLAAAGLFALNTAAINKKIRALSRTALTYDLETQRDAEPCGEGELAALENAIEELGSRVSYRVRALGSDKEYLKNLLSDISHQLKTPLAALRMYIEIMSEHEDLSKEKKQEFLTLCRAQIDRTDWLVQGLLKMARVEAGAVKMHMRESYLADTVEQACAPFIETAKRAAVCIKNNVAADIMLRHDRDWVAEAVGNLVKNAIEHTPSGGTVSITAGQTPMCAELHIKDNGCGMETTEIPHVFERFYSKNAAPDSHSVGIGLSLAKEIIEKNNGSIYVKSAPGEGSEFILTFLKAQN